MRQRTNTPVIIGLGEILWDLLPSGRQLGGAPANFAYHARALGTQAAVVSAVGADDLGHEIIARLDKLGLNHNFVAIDPRHPTGTVTVQVDILGKPAYTIHENTAWDFIPFSPDMESLADTADAICFGSLGPRSPDSRHTIYRFLQAARPECQRIFDINLRQEFYSRPLIEESLRMSNVLKLNDDELPVLAEMFHLTGRVEDQLVQLLHRYSLSLIALTRGPHGALLQTPFQQSQCAGFPTAIADTVGAGDAFTAALAVGLLAGDPLDTINNHACRLAAYVCSQQGATPPLPAELTANMAWPSHTVGQTSCLPAVRDKLEACPTTAWPRNAFPGNRTSPPAIYPFRLGTTSFIYPDRALANVEKLAGRVKDIELLFFEVADPAGLPSPTEMEQMQDLQRRHHLTFSLHTPLDVHLADDDPQRRRQDIQSILHAITLAKPLNPRLYVVHVNQRPSVDIARWQTNARASLRALLDAGIEPRRLGVETMDYDFSLLEPIIAELGLAVVLDIGHLWRDGVAFAPVLRRNLPRTRIIHWHGVTPAGQDHRSLAHFPAAEARWLLHTLREHHYDGVLTLEVFRENDFEESLRLLQKWMQDDSP